MLDMGDCWEDASLDGLYYYLVAGEGPLSAKVPTVGRPPAKTPDVFSVVMCPDFIPNWGLCFSCLSSACGFGGEVP